MGRIKRKRDCQLLWSIWGNFAVWILVVTFICFDLGKKLHLLKTEESKGRHLRNSFDNISHFERFLNF